MDVITFEKRWKKLLECHRHIQPESLLRPILEIFSGDVHLIKYEHTSTQGWTIAFHPKGVMVKAYDLDEITPYTFSDVRPHFVLPPWALEIYNQSYWNSVHTTSFRFGDFESNDWHVPWLALEWLPINAHSLLEPDVITITFWASWYGCPDIAEDWLRRVIGN